MQDLTLCHWEVCGFVAPHVMRGTLVADSYGTSRSAYLWKKPETLFSGDFEDVVMLRLYVEYEAPRDE